MKKAEKIKEQLIRTLNAEILKLESGVYGMSMKNIKIEEGSVNLIDPKTEPDDDDFENATTVTFEEFDIKLAIKEIPNYLKSSIYKGYGKASISYDGNSFTAIIDHFRFE